MDTCHLFWNEYELVYSTYESFNGSFLTLKGWSVSIALAAIIAVYSERIGVTGKVVLWVAALASIPFWLLDTLWKSYQSAYLGRLEFLEELGDCRALTGHELGIVVSWQAEHSEFGLLKWLEFALNSAFPHVFVLVVGMILALRFPPKSTRPGT